MNRRYPRSRPFISWRGIVFGAAIAVVGIGLGFLATLAIKGYAP